jgi:hypothetical protein
MPFLTGPIGGNRTFANIFFITEWIALKLKILTDIKIRSTKNLFTIGPVVFATGTQTCATELKKIDYSSPQTKCSKLFG